MLATLRDRLSTIFAFPTDRPAPSVASERAKELRAAVAAKLDAGTLTVDDPEYQEWVAERRREAGVSR